MSKLDDKAWAAKHIYKAHGTPTINLDGAIDLGHDDGLALVDSTVIQLPTPDNGHNAIVHVRVTTDRGSFAAHGESSEDRDSDVNERTGEKTTKPPVAMAEARALTRALLLATNNGLALAGDTQKDTQRVPASPPAPPQPAQHKQKEEPAGHKPPTSPQLSVLTELATQLGEPIPAPLSYDDAGDLITRLGNDLRRTRTRSA